MTPCPRRKCPVLQWRLSRVLAVGVAAWVLLAGTARFLQDTADWSDLNGAQEISLLSDSPAAATAKRETAGGTGHKLPVPLQVDKDVSTRHLTLRDRCAKLGRRGGRTILPRFSMSPIISSSHTPKLFYCPLAKAGSTYFTRYLIAATSPGPMGSPFSINIKNANRKTLEDFRSLRDARHKTDFLANSFRFLFTRNPYSRIFSAYIDKLYSPNPYYWNDWGMAAVKLSRLPLQAHPCGTNVSFRDFIKALIASLHRKDMHFIPMTTMCSVCDVDWDMVGQVELSAPDIDFLSAKINVSSAFLHTANYSEASANDVIVDSTTDVFTDWFDEVKGCMDMFDAGLVVWRKLQIRGVIYNDAPFPFSRKDMASMTSWKFQEAARSAASDAVDKARLRRQKTDAMHEAYATVDARDLATLTGIYYTDFFLFGYDSKPATIFGISHRKKESKILDWKQTWT